MCVAYLSGGVLVSVVFVCVWLGSVHVWVVDWLMCVIALSERFSLFSVCVLENKLVCWFQNLC